MQDACVSVDDGSQDLADSELANKTGERFMVYRVGPKSVTKGNRLFLHTFDYTPSLEEIKDLFGGGEFWVQVYSNGSYSKGSPRIAIEGDPKILKDNSPEKVLDSLPVSSDPVVNVLMQTVVQFMDRMVEEIKELKGVARTSTGLNAEKIKELMNVATEAQLTNKLVLMATGAGESSAADKEAIADRRLKALLDMFKMGIETGRESDGGDESAGLLGKFAPLLEKLLASPLMGNVPGPGLGGIAMPPPSQNIPSAPIIDVSGTSDASTIESHREKLESETQEYKTQMLVQNLLKGVSAMLDALESDVEYSDSQICDFIMAATPIEELSLVRTHLTFDKVRLLMQSNPQDQIALDSNKTRVDAILSELASKLPE